jgi:hypothetical protein
MVHGATDFFWARALSKNKTIHEGTANKERQELAGGEMRLIDLGVVEWRTPVGRAERAGDREGGERDAGADRNVDEGEGEENDGGREKQESGGEIQRRGRKRGNARGDGENASRKGERRGRWRRRSQQQCTKTRKGV